MESRRTINRVNMPRETKRAVVCTAIKQLRTLEFFYHEGYLIVEPFALGIVLNKRDADNESLICWQTEGFSDLRERVGWKLYRLSEMEDLEILKEKFDGDRPNYDPDDIAMDKVLCCVRLKPVPAAGPEMKVQAVMVYLTHNEVMTRFRYAHPMPFPQLQIAVWPDPLIVRPFSRRIRSTIWSMSPVLDTQMVEQMA